MYHYLFTNDLRITELSESLFKAGTCFRNDTVPDATVNKSANNYMNTLGFYFNLTNNSVCAKECSIGNVRKVVLNFVKKFQFPNPRTKESYESAKNDGICLAPMRVIVKLLYMMNMHNPRDAYLTAEEIENFIFYNLDVAKTKKIDYFMLIRQIEDYRESGNLPDTVDTDPSNKNWKHQDRQLREMLKILDWAGCVTNDKIGNFILSSTNLSLENKADIYDILTYNEFWEPQGDTFSEIKKSYETYMDIEDIFEEKKMADFETEFNSPFSRNRIIFGAPGTGKSYTLNEERIKLLGEGNEEDYERVTFHPDYSYANFVGAYKPVPSINRDGKDTITYEYVPGPFMRVYVKALQNRMTENPRPFLLIIEEINRANVAAVFGDIFQLLDRGDDQVSEYPIEASEDLKKYLAKEMKWKLADCSKIIIPDNMFIWATMNSADQGVFPMDTAFKRRWDFTYLGIDDNDKKIRGKYVYLAKDCSQKVEWNELRKAINNFLADKKINEDKQLGPYFISRDIVEPEEGDEIDRDKFIHTFKNKVIMYLFEDAARQKHSQLFEDYLGNARYSEICKEFDEKGINIFCNGIRDKVKLEQVVDVSEDYAD